MRSKDLQPSQREWPELLQAARENCDNALSEIISRLQGYLLLIANGQIRDNVRAKFGASDIVQNSLLEAHSAIHRFRGSTEAEMRAWLKQIVMHNLVDESRRYTSTQSRSVHRERSLEVLGAPLSTRGSGISDTIDSTHEKVKLNKAVSRLSARQRRVIEGRHRFGYSFAEIALQLEVSEAMTRKIWSQAVERLSFHCVEVEKFC